MYTNIIKNIDFLFLLSIITLSILSQTMIYNFINNNDFIIINKEKYNLLKIEFSIKNKTVI